MVDFNEDGPRFLRWVSKRISGEDSQDRHGTNKSPRWTGPTEALNLTTSHPSKSNRLLLSSTPQWRDTGHQGLLYRDSFVWHLDDTYIRGLTTEDLAQAQCGSTVPGDQRPFL